MSSISVQSRTLFPSSSQQPVPPVLLASITTNITIAELIRQAVVRQIAELQQQQTLKEAEASRAIEQHYLTAEEINSQALPETSSNCVAKTEQHTREPGEILKAVRQAWRAFERRAYIIVIDGKIARSLEEEIPCLQDRKVTFLRLVPLVGG